VVEKKKKDVEEIEKDMDVRDISLSETENSIILLEVCLTGPTRSSDKDSLKITALKWSKLLALRQLVTILTSSLSYCPYQKYERKNLRIVKENGAAAKESVSNIACRQSQNSVTTDGQSTSLSWCKKRSVTRDQFFFHFNYL
jgi:hypothetical protein